jgi:hypothetical protein
MDIEARTVCGESIEAFSHQCSHRSDIARTSERVDAEGRDALQELRTTQQKHLRTAVLATSLGPRAS